MGALKIIKPIKTTIYLNMVQNFNKKKYFLKQQFPDILIFSIIHKKL